MSILYVKYYIRFRGFGQTVCVPLWHFKFIYIRYDDNNNDNGFWNTRQVLKSPLSFYTNTHVVFYSLSGLIDFYCINYIINTLASYRFRAIF